MDVVIAERMDRNSLRGAHGRTKEYSPYKYKKTRWERMDKKKKKVHPFQSQIQ